MAILVTGGAGYIGSHTVVELQSAGYDVVVIDNLSNSSEKSLKRVEAITGKPVTFYEADILDREALNKIFEKREEQTRENVCITSGSDFNPLRCLLCPCKHLSSVTSCFSLS